MEWILGFHGLIVVSATSEQGHQDADGGQVGEGKGQVSELFHTSSINLAQKYRKTSIFGLKRKSNEKPRNRFSYSRG